MSLNREENIMKHFAFILLRSYAEVALVFAISSKLHKKELA